MDLKKRRLIKHAVKRTRPAIETGYVRKGESVDKIDRHKDGTISISPRSGYSGPIVTDWNRPREVPLGQRPKKKRK
jgi:hypothetical protein